MEVKEFTQGYSSVVDTLKDTYLKDNLKINKYVPLSTKLNVADKITSISMLDGDNIKINSASIYILTVLNIIDLYTNIDIDFTDVINQYDMLAENNLVNMIIGNYIPEHEVKEFEGFVHMSQEDIMTNRYEPKAWIESQVTRFGELAGVTVKPLFEKLIDTINNLDDKKVEKYINMLNSKFGNK